jgi:VCBS repeat-containing protein
MGIDASRSLQRTRSNKSERRKGFRNLLCENLERREVMAGSVLDTDFRLLSVAPNTGEILSNTRANNLAESPRELIFRFTGGDDVQASTLRNGIRIMRSGGDGVFGAGGPSADVPIRPEYLDFADSSNSRVVVARFAQPLPDDLYSVEIFGVDIPSQGIRAIRTVELEPLNPRKSGTDRDTYTFNLELGTKIAAVVPQPMNRSTTGVLSQDLDVIEVYFNDSELFDLEVKTGDITPNPTVVDPRFYNLIATGDSVTPFDDVVFNPTEVAFNPATRMATLRFSGPIHTLGGSGTYRLRIGSDNALSSAINNTTVPLTPIAGDPQGHLSGAFGINGGVPITSNFAAIFEQEIRTVSNPLLLDFPGSSQEPGHRDIQEDRSLRSPDIIWGRPNFAPDASPEIRTIRYNFMEGQAYGVDSNGRQLFTSINSEQKQRVREIFEFYSRHLGVDFLETSGPTTPGVFNIVVGDMIPIRTIISGPGDILGAAGQVTNLDDPMGDPWDMVILDGSEPWDNAFGFGVSQKPLGAETVPDSVAAQQGPFSFFNTAMHEIGHLLGLDHTYDLPAGTIMGSDSNGGTSNASGGVVGTRLNSPSNPLEQIFPGTIDQIHGQHLFRPDNRDVDIYRFELAASGQVRLETIAERLNNSSSLDTYVTLLKRDANGLSIVAANNNYFSQDSFIDVALSAGEYFVAVTGKGNEDSNPLVEDTGSGATSQGRYQLRFEFKSTSASSIAEQSSTSSALGSALDGDGDGIAGGDFHFWFRTAAGYGAAAASPRTLIVDKAYIGLTSDGTLGQPFKNISDAVAIAQPGDIIRLAGLDEANPIPSLTTVRAYEVGTGAFGSTLSDGAQLEVPRGVTLMIDAGAILKFGNSRILVGSDGVIDRSGAAIQVLGTPTLPVYFTSYTDQSLGIDTNPLETSPKAGDWGGIEIRNDFDRSQGRLDREREGIFLNTISNANMTYGGGLIGSGSQAKVTSPIELAEARPLIIGNVITRSADSAISADPNSFEETLFTEPRYQNGGAFVPDYRRVGPVIYNNDIRFNTINGLFMRVDTLPGQPLKNLTTHARIDDVEIAIVFGENFVIAGAPGGALNEVARPNTTLMILDHVAPPVGGGFGTAATLEYLVTYIDRFGQESLPSASSVFNVPANRSVRLQNIPAATGDYVSRKIYRRINGIGSFRLAATLNRDQATFTDNNVTLPGALQTQGLTQVNRARQDASLVIDPGMVAKLLGTRLEVGIGATLLAEGTEAKPIIFTSRLDDRYGAGGTFDTNNDLESSSGSAGNWSGILARHMSELSIDHARITFGGGESRVPGGFASFNAIEVHQATARIANSLIESNASGRTNTGGTNRDARGNNDASAIFVLASQPVIINNVIRNNDQAGTAAISMDLSSLNARAVRDAGRATGFNARENTLGIGNFGPLVFNNRLGDNGFNGMRVRGGTLMTESVWDDTDIVHVLQSEVIVPDFHTFGGLRLVSKSDSSLVIKAGSNAGITAAGRPLDIKDRIGGTVQILGSPGFPVVITSLRDDSIGAGFDDQGASLVDTNNDKGGSTPQPGDWRSVRFTPFSNDRNVDMTYELESDRIAGSGDNDIPSRAQDIGKLAGDLRLGDENLRLGVTLTGSIATPTDMDVYRFAGVAGSTLWLDVDQSAGSLDSMVELIDASGVIMALSDDSLAESLDAKLGTGRQGDLSNPAYPTAIRAYPMDQLATANTNRLASGANVDFQGTNPRDAGMRVILPGVAGTTNQYFVRVRSSNKRPGVVTDPFITSSGSTIGAYKLHLRLQEKQEIAGSTVRFADLRFATSGIEVYGNPMRSPLVGEFAELSNDASNDAASALNIGNVMVNDRAGVSIAGTLSTASDIDWFNFEVGRDEDSIQRLPGNTSNPALRVDAHQSLIFDLDYADGLGRANTQLWIFERGPGGQLTLVLTADDSSIQDDQPAILKGTDQSDLTRGSMGKRDAYIGPIELPPGQYTVAITNKSVTAVGLSQFTQSDVTTIPGAQNLRLEPLDSVARLGEDRFEPSPVLTTANGAPAVFAGGQVPFNLSDVTLFASRGTSMSFANAMTGALEANMSRDGQNAVEYINGFTAVDIAVSPAGTAMGYSVPTAPITDANAGQFFGIDIGETGMPQPGTGGSGIVTWSGFVDDNGNVDARPSADFGAGTGDGMVFTALTYTGIGATSRANLFGVASRRGNGTFNEFPDIPAGLVRNVVYLLNPDTGAAVSFNAPNRAEADYEANPGLFGVTAGTNIVEAGSFPSAVGRVEGLTTVGTGIFGVTDQGELVTPRILGLSNPSRVVINDPATGQPIRFTGLTRGPANVENERFAEMLFGVSATGVLYAFNTTGELQPIFPFGATSIPLAFSPVGIDFSSLDANLWHIASTDVDSTSPTGHGRAPTFNQSGDSQTTGNRTIRFAVPNNFPNQNLFGIDNFSQLSNTYSMPGGAWGAFESSLLDLSSYSADDQPVIYFNYNLLTQNAASNDDGNIFGDGSQTSFFDSFRVYGAGEDGQWVLLTTNNSAGYEGPSYADGALFPPFSEYDVPRNGNQDAFGRSHISSQAFDNQGWRQARVNLGSLAGKRDVKIRFEFNSGGDFRTNDPIRNGIDVSAIPGDRISDGDTFEITTPTATVTFEFDLGLVLNVPSGRSLAAGNQLKIGAELFTFSATAGPNQIPFSATDSPQTVANSIANVLRNAGYTVITRPTDPAAPPTAMAANILNITELAGVRLPDPVAADDYAILGGDPSIIVGRPGVTPGNVPVFIDNAMPAFDDTPPPDGPLPNVRDAIRTALALGLNVAGQETNVDVWRFHRDTIKFFGTGVSVSDPGVLRLSGGRVGDLFGPRDTSFRFTQAAGRTLNNGTTSGTRITPMSVAIDDIVISFAERGEMVTNAQPFAGNQFLPTFQYERYGGPDGAPAQEIETGAYQLEIRTAPDYGRTQGQDLVIAPVPFVGPNGRTFDTNERLIKGLALSSVGLSGRIGDGFHFSLSNGVDLVTFEFNVFTSNTDPAFRPTIPGRFRIPLSPNATDGEIALAIRNAINDSSVRALLGVTAQINGDMLGTPLFNDALGTTIQLNGNAASDLFGSANFTLRNSAGNPSTTSLGVIRYGQETQWGEDIGDGNILREQGQIIISGATVLRSAQYGIDLIAPPRDLSNRFINMDVIPTGGTNNPRPISTESINRSYPGSVRNMITLNNSRIASGPVVINNILAGNGSGGIRVGGDTGNFATSQPEAPVTVARIVNNTIYGSGSDTNQSGIEVQANTSPTILSNIIANLARGINVANDPALLNSIVIGANLYQGNGPAGSGPNVVPASLDANQSFPIALGAGEPLFTNPSRDQFYLRALSRAIDSSIASLEDRNLLDQVRAAIGLPTSPIIAPEFDAYGLLRSDDPAVSTPGGLGSNVFADRGALDRVDSTGPQAILQRPLDNDSAGNDRDPFSTYIRLASGNVDYFEILIDERQGTGPDPLTIDQNNVVLTQNGRILVPDVDYVFGYSFNSRTIRLTPLGGFWRQDSVYELTLINKPTLRIVAPDNAVDRSDGDTFTVTLQSGGSRTLELDSGYILTVPAGGVSDGQTFTYQAASGQTTVFEFNLAGNTQTLLNTQVITFTASDTPDTLAGKIAQALNPFVRQNGWPVQAIGGGRVAVGGNVGDILDVTSSALTLAGTPGVAAGRTAVRFLPIESFDAVAMANQLTKAFQQMGSGVKAYTLANGLVFIEGVSAVSGVPSLNLVPINDLAGNLLQANRANALTQFTILMPEVSVDYGDAIERTGTGSNSSTLMANNGVRHALYPDDAMPLTLGVFADGDTDGIPSIAADGDDFDSSLNLGTLSPFVSINANGPARLVTAAVSASTFGKTLSITDAIGNRVTYQYTDSANPLTNPSFVSVDLTGLSSASQVATALKNAVLNSILAGSITGIHAESTGNVVSLGGSSDHLFDLSDAGTEITRSLAGSIGLTINNDLTGLTAGQSLSITDGSGNTVGFQIFDTDPLAPVGTLLSGNYAVRVNLSAVTASDLASAMVSAINQSIQDSRLRLPTVTGSGTSLVISGDDEDGVSYNRWFNKDALPTPITITASASGMIDAWIDWNQDNDFNDAGERILSSEPVVAGTNTFYVTTPASAAIGFTTARFRLSSTGDLFTYGLGIGGEVEDHLIEVLGGSPPVGIEDRYVVAEDTPLNVSAPGVLVNDSDIDGNPIRVYDSDRRVPGIQPVRQPEFGYLTLNTDGSFDYIPKQDFYGTDIFVYDVTDGRMTGNQSVTVTITVTPVNDAPVAVDDTVDILEDTTTTWDGSLFTDNDRTQPDRAPGTDGDLFDTNESLQILTVIGVELVTPRGLGETIAVVDNQITYTPPSNYNDLIDGPVLVRVLIQDSGVAGGDAEPKSPGQDDVPPVIRFSTLTIKIGDVNDRPQFTMPNSVETPLEDASAIVTGFLTDIAPSPSTALDELGPTSATPSLVRQGVEFLVRALDPTRFTATGQPEISPSGELTYTLNTDVNALNSGPILVEVIAQDDGDAPGSRPGIPDLNRSLPVTFTIRPTEVNDAPQFVIPNPLISITEDLEVSPIVGFASNIQAGPNTALDELGLITGVPGQSVLFVVEALDPTRFAVQPQISPAGTLTYDLSPDVNRLNSGDIIVRVYAVDSGPAAGDRAGIPDVNRSPDQFFTIQVAEINDAPEFTITNPLVSVLEDNEQVTLTTPTRINGFASGVRPGPITAVDEAGQTIAFNIISSTNPNLFSVQPSIDAAGNLTFVTAADQNGTSIFVVRLEDNGTSSPPPNDNTSNNATFTITVRSVNDAPQFTLPSTVVSDEDQGLVTIPGFARDILPGPDTAFDELRQTLIFEVTANDPSVFEVQPSLTVDGTLTYKTTADLNSNAGKDARVVVRLRDDGVSGPAPDTNLSIPRTFTVTITPINDPPIPGAYTTSTDEDIRKTIQSDDVLAGAIPGPADEIGEGQTVRITNIESTTVLGGTVLPVFQGNRIVNFDYIPPLNFVGQDTIRYVITDSGTYTPGPRSATGTITINISPINDPPVFTSGGNVAVLEDSAPYSAVWATGIAAGPQSAVDELTGPTAQTVSFDVTTTNASMFSVQPAVSPSGQLTFTLAKDANGQVAVIVTAVDSGLASPPPNNNRSRPVTFTLTVDPVNDEPDFSVLQSIVVPEDSGPFSGTVLGSIVPAIGNNAVPPTALDESTQSITFTVTNDQPGLFAVQPSISSSGVLTFTPALDRFGLAVVQVFATDSGPGNLPNVNVSATKTLTITILPSNDAPFASDDRYSTSETTVLNVAAPGLLINDIDSDPNDILSIANFQSTSSLGAQVSVNPNGSFSYNPTVSARIRELIDGQTINDTFTYRAKDSSNIQSNLATVTITVSGFNDAPVAVNDTFTVPFNTTRLLSVLDNDFDVDTPINVASIEIGILPVNGTATPTADGKVRYVPNTGFRGIDSFTYRVRDSLGKVSSEATVSLRVNTIPVANPDSFTAKRGVATILDVLSNDIDPDGSIVPSTVTIVSQPNNAIVTVLANGQIEFTSQDGFVGTSRFQYVVSDNDGSPSAPTDVTVQVVSSLYQNQTNIFDVNADSFVSPIDVLVIINLLNTQGPSIPVDGLPGPPDFVDVNGDNRVDPLDALAVINHINSGGSSSEGEGGSGLALGTSIDTTLWGWTWDQSSTSKALSPNDRSRLPSEYGVPTLMLANAAQPHASNGRAPIALSLADYLASVSEDEDDVIESASNAGSMARNRSALDEAFANLFDD